MSGARRARELGARRRRAAAAEVRIAERTPLADDHALLPYLGQTVHVSDPTVGAEVDVWGCLNDVYPDGAGHEVVRVGMEEVALLPSATLVACVEGGDITVQAP